MACSHHRTALLTCGRAGVRSLDDLEEEERVKRQRLSEFRNSQRVPTSPERR